MGGNGRVLAETEFDVRQVVSKHLQVYSAVLEPYSERSSVSE
jgi:hypothetical protein